MRRRDLGLLGACLGGALGVMMVQPVVAAPVTVTMVQFPRAQEADWQKALVDRFNKSHTDIQIELIVPGGTAQAKALAMLAAGDPPDIVDVDPYTTIKWGLQGLALDLTPYLKRDADVFKDFYPTSMRMHSVNGHQYGIPEDLQVQGFLYVKGPFDEAGLAYPDDSWTWAQVRDISSKLVKDTNGDGTPERYAMRDPQYLHWWPILWSFGAEFVDDPKVPTRFTGDTAQMREGLTWFHTMIKELHTMPLYGGSKGTTAQQLVDTQTAAMAIGNSLYEQAMIPRADEVPWDVARLPKGPTGSNTAFVNSIGWVVLKGSKHPDAAWEVLKYFSSPEAMHLAVEMRGTLVPYVPVTRDEWMRRYNVPEHRRAFIDAIATGQPLPIIYDDGLTSIRNNTRDYWNGRITLSQALENMDTQVSTWITEIKGS